MNETQTSKKQGPGLLWTIVSIIIIAGIAFLLFKPSDKAEAPTTDDVPAVATTTDANTSTTTVQAPADTMPQQSGEERVIEGDGFTATIRNVGPTGPTPVIVSFTVDQNGERACRFKWEVTDAATCNFATVGTQIAVKNVPLQSGLQTDDAGQYRLECAGSGGIETVSQTLTCE